MNNQVANGSITLVACSTPQQTPSSSTGSGHTPLTLSPSIIMSNTPAGRYKLPPGPSFIASQVLSWKTAGYITSVALIRVGADAIGVYAPVWAIIASSVVALPAALYIKSELQYWRNERTALALGARLAPKVAGKKPLGIDLITAILKAHETGYIGASQAP